MEQQIHPPVGPLPDWDPEVQGLVEAWPDQLPGDEGLAALRGSRRDRLPPSDLARDGVFRVSHQSIASRSQASLDLTILVPARAAACGAIYWLHSGGQVGGSSVSPDLVPVLEIAERHALVVVAAEYALAPEHPAPAGLHDAYDGLLWTAGHAVELAYPREALFLHGLSGGGGLAAGAALMARDAGIAMAGLVLDGPMLDDRLHSVSMRQHQQSGLTMIDSLRLMWRAVIGPDDSVHRRAPHAAPGRLSGEDLSGLPPAYIVCGANDPFRDEVTAFAQGIWRSGGSADLHQWAGIGHGFDLLASDAHVCEELIAGRRAWYDRMLHRVHDPRVNTRPTRIIRRRRQLIPRPEPSGKACSR